MGDQCSGDGPRIARHGGATAGAVRGGDRLLGPAGASIERRRVIGMPARVAAVPVRPSLSVPSTGERHEPIASVPRARRAERRRSDDARPKGHQGAAPADVGAGTSRRPSHRPRSAMHADRCRRSVRFSHRPARAAGRGRGPCAESRASASTARPPGSSSPRRYACSKVLAASHTETSSCDRGSWTTRMGAAVEAPDAVVVDAVGRGDRRPRCARRRRPRSPPRDQHDRSERRKPSRNDEGRTARHAFSMTDTLPSRSTMAKATLSRSSRPC